MTSAFERGSSFDEVGRPVGSGWKNQQSASHDAMMAHDARYIAVIAKLLASSLLTRRESGPTAIDD